MTNDIPSLVFSLFTFFSFSFLETRLSSSIGRRISFLLRVVVVVVVVAPFSSFVR